MNKRYKFLAKIGYLKASGKSFNHLQFNFNDLILFAMKKVKSL